MACIHALAGIVLSLGIALPPSRSAGAEPASGPNVAAPATWYGSTPPIKAFAGRPQSQLPHEKTPDVWPQPDYFGQALLLTPFQVDQRFASLHLRLDRALVPRYIVLPVQTQTFGFSPEFRALIGAELDRQLKTFGIDATSQTEIVDANGPYARRLTDDAVRGFAVANPGKKLITLYVGHDGAGQAFIDLSVGVGNERVDSHRSASLPDEPLPALQVLAKLMPELIRAAGLQGRPATATAAAAAGAGAFRCSESAWTLTETSATDETRQACRALVIGTLLPPYDDAGARWGEMMPATKMAWLARAYSIAARGASTSETAKAVRDLSLAELRLGTPERPPLAFVRSDDPVVSRLAALLSVKERTASNPARSQQDLIDRDVAKAVVGLPKFASAVFIERANFDEAFRRIDFCAIETSFSGPVMRSDCAGSLPRSRASGASDAELLLYQEWRIASSYKDLLFYGVTQGNSVRAREIVAALPSDVAAHPFVQRLRFRIESDPANRLGGTFDELLARTRTRFRDFVQSTANLQRDDGWMALYSLSGHAVAGNVRVVQDPEIHALVSSEARLLMLASFDRFSADPDVHSRLRSQGSPGIVLDPAFDPSVAAVFNMPASPRQSPTGSSGVPIELARAPQPSRSFPPDGNEGSPSLDALEKRLLERPQSMDLRARIAIARLKAGAPVQDAIALFKAQADDRRTDDAVSESHLWSLPAHVLFLSGEVDAARPFYEKVRTIGTGSSSDLMARARLELIDGRVAAARDATEARLTRYESDYARRDLMGLRFMTGQSSAAWPLFFQRAEVSDSIQVWFGASIGQRMSGLGLPDIRTWIAEKHLDKVQIEYVDAASLYLHLMAVTDRSPSDGDVAILQGLSGRDGRTPMWAKSAILARSAFDEDPRQVYAEYTSQPASSGPTYDFMLPLFTWVAAQAGHAQDEDVVQVRKASLSSDFDHTLAKSLLLALEGNDAESLRYLGAARFELATLTWGGRNDLGTRPISPEYQYALAGYLMYRKTHDKAYRIDALRFLRSRQKAFPYFSWTYSMEAALETDAGKQALAVCRARFLDPRSEFLKLATAGKPTPRCAAALW